MTLSTKLGIWCRSGYTVIYDVNTILKNQFSNQVIKPDYSSEIINGVLSMTARDDDIVTAVSRNQVSIYGEKITRINLTELFRNSSNLNISQIIDGYYVNNILILQVLRRS